MSQSEVVDMIGSNDGWHSLARLARVFLLAAVIFGLAASSAMAQQAQQAPAGAPKSDFSSWVKVCAKNAESGNKQVCLVKYEELDPRTGSVLLTAAVRTVEGQDGRQLIINVPLAYTLIIPAGVQVRIDDHKPVSMQFAVCLATGCQAQIALSKEMLQKMMGGKKLIVAAVNMREKIMAFPIPLVGFSKTWKGAPVDTDKYQAARRQMLDFARKTAERQREGQQSGAQLQAGGNAAQAPRPNASTTVPKRVPAPAAQ
jgi:invasion protein IalB